MSYQKGNMGKKVLITGATGMIGGLVLGHCLESDEISEVISLTRRPSNIENEKLTEIIVEDFLNLNGNSAQFESLDVVYYCLGVYTGAVNRKTFRKITVDFPEALAQKLQYQKQNIRFCLLSGAGADRKERSRMMFARDKGIIENRLSKMGFKGFHAFRPGYIYPVTSRREPNLSYKIMRALYPLIKRFGNSASITSIELANAMFEVGLKGSSEEILENKDILAIVHPEQEE